MTDVIVKKSNIHGKGVFAARDFKKGEVVIDWTTCSKILDKNEVDVLPKHQRKYVSFLEKGKWVLFKNPGKYVNHSCEANTVAIRGCDVANRDIQKGEEITADYAAEKVIAGLRCSCGSKKCKKIIGPIS